MKSIVAPTHCPSCDAPIVWVNHILYCNNFSCESQLAKKVEHFTKVLKIKGFGPKTIEKLGLTCIADLYELSKEDLKEKLNSDLLGDKLYRELENSKKAPLNLVLPAFSIPLVGSSTTEKLSKVCKHISEINLDTCTEAGLGPKVIGNLLNWLETQYPSVSRLPFNYTFAETTRTVKDKGVVCISGRLSSFKSKTEATNALEAVGFVVKDSLTKDVTILINESGVESAKTKQARASGVKIINNLGEMLCQYQSGLKKELHS